LEKTGARAVVGCAVRVRQGNKAGWKVIFREPDERIYAEHIQQSLIGLNTSVENIVNEFPEQYQWEYKRFKRLPPGVKRPY
jgi:KDO2-lipid IV(A) lauroyltransferase